MLNEVNGVINANGAQLLEIDTGNNTVINFGVLESTSTGGLKIDSNVVNFGKLVDTAGHLEIVGSVSGGTASVGPGGELIFDSAADQNVIFTSTTGGGLKLGDSSHFSGTITGFGGNNTDFIDLADFAWDPGNTTATFTSTDNIHGVLAILNTTTSQEVDLNLVGNYNSTTFTAATDGSGGTIIHDPVIHIAHHHGDHLV